MSFTTDLLRFGEAAKFKQEQALRKVSFELFSRVIMRTPVDTGRLRGNWQATVKGPANGEVEVDDNASPVRQRGEGSSIAKQAMALKVLGENDPTVFYLTNTLPYAGVIEYGSSKQAPQGMVRISVAEYQDIVSEVTSAL